MGPGAPGGRGAHGRAEAVWQAGAYDRADSMLRVAIRILSSQTPPDEQAFGEALSNRATVLGSKGEYVECGIAVSSGGGQHPTGSWVDHLEMALDLSNLGLALLRLGRLDGADSALRDRWLYGAGSWIPGTPASCFRCTTCATNLLAQGRLEEGERLGREVVTKRRRLYPHGHPDLAVSLHVLHKILGAGEARRGRGPIEETLAIRRAWLGPDHPQTLETQANLAMAKYWTGNLAGAESAAPEALAGYRRGASEPDPTGITILGAMGVILRETGRYADDAAPGPRSRAPPPGAW